MKRTLLEAVAETRRREAELEALCKDAPPDPALRWRVQDHLAHLAWFREHEAMVVNAVGTGSEIPPDLDESTQNADAVYLLTRDQALSTVIANVGRSWDLMEAAIDACSEEDLAGPHPHRKGRRLVDDSPGNHVGAHMMWCYLDAADEAAAEAVQVWAHDLSARTFDDQRSRAVATYNLACFYARVRRPEIAVPMLRDSFEGSPDLKDWAFKDPDLDPIRQDPSFVEMMGVNKA